MWSVLIITMVYVFSVLTLGTGCGTPRSHPRHQTTTQQMVLADADTPVDQADASAPGIQRPPASAGRSTTVDQVEASAPRSVGPPASSWSGGYVEPTDVAQDDVQPHRVLATAEGLMSVEKQAFTFFSVGGAGKIQRKIIKTHALLPLGVLRGGAGLIFGFDQGEFVATDASSGQTAWRAPASVNARGLYKVFEVDRAVVAVSLRGSALNTNAFERAGGRPLWSFETEGSSVAADGQRFYIMSPQGVLTARSGTTGAIAWTRDLGPSTSGDSPSLIVGPGYLIADVPGHGLRVLDGWSGLVKLTRPDVEDVESLAARDGLIFFATQHRSRPGVPGELKVSAIELDSGAELWRTQIHHTSFEYGQSPLWLGNNTVYGCAANGRLFALDMRSGRLLWQYCLGFCPDVVHVKTGREPEVLLVRMFDGELLAFGPTPETLLPPIDLVVQGRVRVVGKTAPRGYRVSVGGTITKTDRGGRYRVKVSGRGRIIAQALEPPGASPHRDGHPSMHHYRAVPRKVPFAGPSPRRVDLEVNLIRDYY